MLYTNTFGAAGLLAASFGHIFYSFSYVSYRVRVDKTGRYLPIGRWNDGPAECRCSMKR